MTKIVVGQYELTEAEFKGKDIIYNSLNLDDLTEIPKGFNPRVSGGLSLNGVETISQAFHPVCSYLHMDKLIHAPAEFYPVVSNCATFKALKTVNSDFEPLIGLHLDVPNLTSTPSGFCPKVGGELRASKLTAISNNFEPIVGNSLILSSLSDIPEGFNPHVGWALVVSPKLKKNKAKLDKLNDLKNISNLVFSEKDIPSQKSYSKKISFISRDEKFIFQDGVLTDILHKRGNLFKVRINLFSDICIYGYVVMEDNGSYYGDSIREALDAAIAQNRDEPLFKAMKLTKAILQKATFDKDTAISIYSKITGISVLDIKAYVKNRPFFYRKHYTLKKILKLSQGFKGSSTFTSFMDY